MTKGKLIGKLWKDMDSVEKIAWRAEHGALEGAALKAASSVIFTQKLLLEDESKKGDLGKYLPLSVYKANGYDKTWLKWIEEHAACRTEEMC